MDIRVPLNPFERMLAPVAVCLSSGQGHRRSRQLECGRDSTECRTSGTSHSSNKRPIPASVRKGFVSCHSNDLQNSFSWRCRWLLGRVARGDLRFVASSELPHDGSGGPENRESPTSGRDQRKLEQRRGWELVESHHSSASVPNAIDASATFGSAITAPRVITVDSPEVVGTISFNNVNRYTPGRNTNTGPGEFNKPGVHQRDRGQPHDLRAVGAGERHDIQFEQRHADDQRHGQFDRPGDHHAGSRNRRVRQRPCKDVQDQHGNNPNYAQRRQHRREQRGSNDDSVRIWIGSDQQRSSAHRCSAWGRVVADQQRKSRLRRTDKPRRDLQLDGAFRSFASPGGPARSPGRSSRALGDARRLMGCPSTTPMCS